MRKGLLLMLLLLFLGNSSVQAQDKLKAQLFYYSPKGLTFIPPFSKPGLVYNGQLYIGRKRLAVLFDSLKDDRLNYHFKKYKANKTPADIIGFFTTVVLPITNLVIASNDGKINWPLVAASAALGGTGGYLNFQAQKHLLYSSLYFDQKMGIKHTSYAPQQTSVGITIPLGK